MLEEEIMSELRKFSLKRNSIGYEYIMEAIKIVSINKFAVKDFKKYVYLPIAEAYDTKPQNVFWCINKLISLMCLNTNKETLEDYFKIGDGDTITTKTFIIGIARKLHNVEKDNITQPHKTKICLM